MTSSGGQLMEATLRTINISVTDLEDNISNNINSEGDSSSGQQQARVDMECPNCKVTNSFPSLEQLYQIEPCPYCVSPLPILLGIVVTVLGLGVRQSRVRAYIYLYII